MSQLSDADFVALYRDFVIHLGPEDEDEPACGVATRHGVITTERERLVTCKRCLRYAGRDCSES
jgi:hypothetical protein